MSCFSRLACALVIKERFRTRLGDGERHAVTDYTAADVVSRAARRRERVIRRDIKGNSTGLDGVKLPCRGGKRPAVVVAVPRTGTGGGFQVRDQMKLSRPLSFPPHHPPRRPSFNREEGSPKPCSNSGSCLLNDSQLLLIDKYAPCRHLLPLSCPDMTCYLIYSPISSSFRRSTSLFLSQARCMLLQSSLINHSQFLTFRHPRICATDS